MDPLSGMASSLAILGACTQATTSLFAVVKRYKGRNQTLSRLSDGLQDFIDTLKLLEKAKRDNETIRMLLDGPVTRCKKICEDFEVSMEKFKAKSKVGLVDWAKMEFMSSDINGFIETLAIYKATIAIGLGIVTMQSSAVLQEVVEQYSEMIQDTTYNLNVNMLRIQQQLSELPKTEAEADADGVKATIDLEKELQVTRDCLLICDEARNHIESLQRQQASSLGIGDSIPSHTKNLFEAQLLTRQALDTNYNGIVKVMEKLQKRLNDMLSSTGTEYNQEKLRLQADIDVSRQCMEVCEQASKQVSRVKILNIGPVIAENDCDQVVVTTIADLFNVERVEAKSGSMQLVASMELEGLKQLSTDRYGSRFGASNVSAENVEVSAASTSKPDGQRTVRRSKDGHNVSEQKRNSGKPSANEIRRRSTLDEHEKELDS